MKKIIVYAVSPILFFVLGYLVAELQDPVAKIPVVQPVGKPAYLISSGKILNPGKIGIYQEATMPLARRAGLQLLASGESGSTVQLLEGDWPYQGFVIVEKYDSMEALMNFWNSPGFRQARKFRKEVIEADFTIAIEGVE